MTQSGDTPRDCLAALSASARAAVDSYYGLSLTLVHDGYPLTLTCPDPLGGGTRNAVAVTSLAVPLSAATAAAAGQLVLFASTPGAFVDLAADLAYTTTTNPDCFQLDAHLETTAGDVPIGVAGFSTINRAVGMLIAAGVTPDQARARIEHIAATDGTTLAAAATRILICTARGEPADGPHPSQTEVGSGMTALQVRAAFDVQVIADLEADRRTDRDMICNLEAALVSARRIGAAIGIIMAAQNLTEDQAFQVLSRISQSSNRTLRDLAEDVLLIGTAE